MNGNSDIILGLIAFGGAIFGPILGYLSAMRKISGEKLLTDIEAIKQWGEQRKALETEIDETRKRYRARLELLEKDIALLEIELRSCEESLKKLL